MQIFGVFFKNRLMILDVRRFIQFSEDKVVQNSAGARQGTTPTQLTLSSKGSASCVVATGQGNRR